MPDKLFDIHLSQKENRNSSKEVTSRRSISTLLDTFPDLSSALIEVPFPVLRYPGARWAQTRLRLRG